MVEFAEHCRDHFKDPCEMKNSRYIVPQVGLYSQHINVKRIFFEGFFVVFFVWLFGWVFLVVVWLLLLFYLGGGGIWERVVRGTKQNNVLKCYY